MDGAVEVTHRIFPYEDPEFIISRKDISSLLTHNDAFFLDCDGVLWQGDRLFHGIKETLDFLASLQKKTFFFTNNSTKSRKQYLKKFHSLGLNNVTYDQIYGSAFAAAAYLDSIQFDRSKSIYVIGEEGICKELEEFGFSYVWSKEHEGRTLNGDTLREMPIISNMGAVIVGWSGSFNTYMLAFAALQLQNNRDCIIVSTNQDSADTTEGGRFIPGAACMFTPFQIMMETIGRKRDDYVNVGKPEQFMLSTAIKTHSFERERCCMVGDRLDTDIEFGKRGGLNTLLTLTGITTMADVKRKDNTIVPDHVIRSFADLCQGMNASSLQ
eukprot:CAMPEP_0184671412 /NCGR_PEP_ID=MMETSP0308-20130426/85477_1 /TAXON_ID=38269 /ORGANISM="Gloeochaete witrockiana, Strain SAG 46.84" /LENGTH=325 /DNA_ID=CAMNT_0027118531 /DNA_START=59 /DNA_END=1036 /DNA_ORIENTATION=-